MNWPACVSRYSDSEPRVALPVWHFADIDQSKHCTCFAVNQSPVKRKRSVMPHS